MSLRGRRSDCVGVDLSLIGLARVASPICFGLWGHGLRAAVTVGEASGQGGLPLVSLHAFAAHRRLEIGVLGRGDITVGLLFCTAGGPVCFGLRGHGLRVAVTVGEAFSQQDVPLVSLHASAAQRRIDIGVLGRGGGEEIQPADSCSAPLAVVVLPVPWPRRRGS